jgi:hypothetical protein
MERTIFGRSAIVTSLATVLISGCVYLQPSVPPDPLSIQINSVCARTDVSSPVRSTGVGAMPNVELAMLRLRAWQGLTERLSDCSDTMTRGLNLATFGLAAGAGIAPVYNAYKDLTTALAIGAGTAYTANTLFFPADQATLYDAAAKSFACIAWKGQQLLSAIPPVRSVPDFDAQFAVWQSQFAQCADDPSFGAVQTAFATARASLSRAIQADPQVATQLNVAGESVRIAVNGELKSRAASSAAVFAAARGVASFSAAGGPGSPAPAAATRIAGLCTAGDLLQIKSQTGVYTSTGSGIDQALDSISQLASACSFSAQALPDLAVSQETVSLTPGAFVNIIVTGGRAPYIPIWDGSDPSGNGITASTLPPNTVRISASSNLKKAASYTLDIRDSSVAGQLKKITVTATPAS